MIAGLSALLFLSGLSALVYEITLVRVLGYAFGHTFYAVSTVLTTYMAGLALGSHLFGKITDRQPDREPRSYGWECDGKAMRNIDGARPSVCLRLPSGPANESMIPSPIS